MRIKMLLMVVSITGAHFFFSTNHATEFLYPVDHVITPDGVKICVIHQKDEHLDVWLWDPVTQEAMKGLLSSYTPAGLTVSPSRTAFCFIDNDRLYVKSLIKKSPQAIDFMGPYELSRITWIDDASFYFSAKERTHYNLFYGTVDGSLCRLTYSKEYDYLYPQKQGKQLFFIERDAQHTHRIKVAHYPKHALKEHRQSWNQDMSFEEKLRLIAQEEATAASECSFINPSTITELYAHNAPGRALSFLSMVSETEGFFIEHASSLTKKDSAVAFNYYQLCKLEHGWTVRLLFGFSIATALLFSHGNATRLYESMYPLLPRVTPTHIYYVTGSNGYLDLYIYERATGTSTKAEHMTSEQYYFVPYIYNDIPYYGGALARLICIGHGQDDHSFNSTSSIPDYTKYRLRFTLDDDGVHTMIFPHITALTHNN